MNQEVYTMEKAVKKAMETAAEKNLQIPEGAEAAAEEKQVLKGDQLDQVSGGLRGPVTQHASPSGKH